MSLNARTHRYTAADAAPFIPLPADEAVAQDEAAPAALDDREAADPADLPQQRRPN